MKRLILPLILAAPAHASREKQADGSVGWVVACR